MLEVRIKNKQMNQRGRRAISGQHININVNILFILVSITMKCGDGANENRGV